MAGYHLYPSKIFFNVLKSGNYQVKSTMALFMCNQNHLVFFAVGIISWHGIKQKSYF